MSDTQLSGEHSQQAANVIMRAKAEIPALFAAQQRAYVTSGAAEFDRELEAINIRLVARLKELDALYAQAQREAQAEREALMARYGRS